MRRGLKFEFFPRFLRHSKGFKPIPDEEGTEM